MNLDERTRQLRKVSNTLVWALGALVAIGIPGAFLANSQASQGLIPTPVAVFFVGFVGGFIGLQRRLKALPADDLTLLANSLVCIVLSPIVGAILAELVYVLFISGLLQGDLFPRFEADQGAPGKGFQAIFELHCKAPEDYAKVLFWSFVAGFSERFATNIIGQFDARVAGDDKGGS